MSISNNKLDIDYVRSQFPAFKDPLCKDWSFFENAGGSYVPQQVIERLNKFMTSTKVQPYAEYPMSKIAGDKMDQATELFANSHIVVRYPLDFSWSVNNFLRRIKPSLIILVELEVWPNMLRFATKKNIPVVVVNGRLTDRSYKRYKLVSCLLRSTFERLSIVGMQNKSYAKKVSSLGAKDVQVLGTMKWDNATIADTIDGVNGVALVVGSYLGELFDVLLFRAANDGVRDACVESPQRIEEELDAFFGWAQTSSLLMSRLSLASPCLRVLSELSAWAAARAEANPE